MEQTQAIDHIKYPYLSASQNLVKLWRQVADNDDNVLSYAVDAMIQGIQRNKPIVDHEEHATRLVYL